jgi:hypothetical protein
MKGFTVTATHVKNFSTDKMKRSEMINKYAGFGASYQLLREPDNECDENAIGVYQMFSNGGRVQIGYVPRVRAEELAPMMDNGHDLQVKFATKILDENTGDFKCLILKFVE